MGEIRLTINDRRVVANEGETILSVARANGLYIPAICCLTRCSATLACRLCMADADGKRVYSCNAKVKEGMVVKTEADEFTAERRAIMQVYAINHPLQCGVCDKSGECELQDNTLFSEVASQAYAIKDVARKAVDWGRTHYDAGLCIACERCVTVCKDMIGASALATTPRGGDQIDESYKASMPKDVYAIWNRLNKSLIALSPKGDLCVDCGECAAVCPTGAMVTIDFQYKSNAWELERVPSSCVHCPAACHLIYETKGGDREEIYRVTNDFHFQSLCGAGRFGYDFANANVEKDEAAFNRALAALKKAKAIRFNSLIANEEILILERLKKRLGLKLINDAAFSYAKFLKTFGGVTGKTLYDGSTSSIGDFTVSIGVRLSNDAPALRNAINNSLAVKKGAAIDFHPIGDNLVDTMHKNLLPMRAEVGTEEIVLAKLLNRFADRLPSEHKAKIADYVFDSDDLAKIDKLTEKLAENKSGWTIVVGSDLYDHARSENLARSLGLLEKYSPFSVILAPPSSNALGAALLADLDESAEGYTVGYNEKGDFLLSAFGAKGENELDMPALNQQEGTFVNIDKRVVPIYPALSYGGYTLADLYNALESEAPLERTIELTSELGVQFDALENYFTVGGEERRGFLLSSGEVESSETLEAPKPPKIAATIVYSANPIDEFNAHLKSGDWLLASDEFLTKLNLADGDKAKVTIGGATATLIVKRDKYIQGEFAFVNAFSGGYRFKSAKITKG